jgi:hypothetical protein
MSVIVLINSNLIVTGEPMKGVKNWLEGLKGEYTTDKSGLAIIPRGDVHSRLLHAKKDEVSNSISL